MAMNALLIPTTPFLPLGPGETYTGQWLECYQWDALTVAFYSDVAGTLYADFSSDGISIDSTFTFDIDAGTPERHRLTVIRRYVRFRYVNNGTQQTEARFQVIGGSATILTNALNATIGLDADAIVTRSIPSMLEVSRGRLTGITKNNKVGRNSDIDTASTPEWIWEVGGVYTGFPDGAAETISVVSTDANDTAAGSGARSVTISGLDHNWDIATETIALNGLTPSAGVKLFRRVHSAWVSSSGSSNTAYNAGVITVHHTTTTANVFLSIQVGRNQSNAAVYTVPAGHIGIKTNLRVEVDRSVSATISGYVYVREFGAPPRLRRPFTASNTSPYYEEPYGGLTFAEKTDIGIVVTACSANNTGVQSAFDIVLIRND